MLRVLVVAFFVFASSYSYADSSSVECRLVGGMPSTFVVKKFSFTKNTDGNTASFKLSTTKGEQNYPNVECKVENTPDSIYSCEDDNFVMILALDETPLKAVINPIVYGNKEHGPFFFQCK